MGHEEVSFMRAILFGTGTAFGLMVLAWLVRYRALSVRRAIMITCLIWSAGLAAYLMIEEKFPTW